jgi:DNA-binding response OmpR family regulator
MTMKCDILVVDDDPNISQVVESILSNDGYRVAVAGSGEEALELFAKGDYSLLISDIVMPGMSGIDLLKKIKQVSADTQVIIMTSHGADGPYLAVDMMQKGADDYVCKPFDSSGPHAPCEAVKRALQRGCTCAPTRCPLVGGAMAAEPEPPPGEPAELRPFSGGKLVFYKDRVELLGHTILTSRGNECSRRVVELLARKARGEGYRAYSGKVLAQELDPRRTLRPDDVAGYVKYLRRRIAQVLGQEGIRCAPDDVIESGGRGYRLNARIEVEGLRS